MKEYIFWYTGSIKFDVDFRRIKFSLFNDSVSNSGFVLLNRCVIVNNEWATMWK
jgi:hypothetical protein